MEKLLTNLKKRGIDGKFFNDKEELKNEILNQISTDKKVGIGGSMTIEELGLYDELKNRGNNVYWHWKALPEEKKETLKEAIFSDFYLCSTNALIEDGRLLNIDGVGNRVSSMFFGPQKVIVVCGKNKICKNYEEAMDRIKTQACPKNARRLDLKTPCALENKCSDCKSKSRMCNIITIIEGKPMNTDISVYILNEEIGY